MDSTHAQLLNKSTKSIISFRPNIKQKEIQSHLVTKMCRLVDFKTILRFLRCNKRAENKTLYSWQKSHFLKFDKGVNKVKWPTMAEFVGELQTYTVSLLEVIQESLCKVSSFVIFACFTFNFHSWVPLISQWEHQVVSVLRMYILNITAFRLRSNPNWVFFPLSISFNKQKFT